MVLVSDSKRPARAEHARLASPAATARGTSPEMPACSRDRILSRTPGRPKLSFGRPTSRSALDSDAAKNGSPGLVASQWPLSTPERIVESQSALSLWHLRPAPPESIPTQPKACLPRPLAAGDAILLHRNQTARQRIATALPQFRPGRSIDNTMPRPGFYLGPTPRLQDFNHLADLRQAPATKPAPEVLPALVMHFASWVTWLEGVIPRTSGRMCGLPPAIVSTNSTGGQDWSFRGSEYRSYSPTPRPPFFTAVWAESRLLNGILGIVSQDTDRQALFEIGPFVV